MLQEDFLLMYQNLNHHSQMHQEAPNVEICQSTIDHNTSEKTALFVMKTFGDDLEKAEIAVQKAQNDYDELRESEDLLPSDASENNDSDSDASQDLLSSDASENNDSDSDTSEESLPATPSEPLRKAWDEFQIFFDDLVEGFKKKKNMAKL